MKTSLLLIVGVLGFRLITIAFVYVTEFYLEWMLMKPWKGERLYGFQDPYLELHARINNVQQLVRFAIECFQEVYMNMMLPEAHTFGIVLTLILLGNLSSLIHLAGILPSVNHFYEEMEKRAYAALGISLPERLAAIRSRPKSFAAQNKIDSSDQSPSASAMKAESLEVDVAYMHQHTNRYFLSILSGFSGVATVVHLLAVFAFGPNKKWFPYVEHGFTLQSLLDIYALQALILLCLILNISIAEYVMRRVYRYSILKHGAVFLRFNQRSLFLLYITYEVYVSGQLGFQTNVLSFVQKILADTIPA